MSVLFGPIEAAGESPRFRIRSSGIGIGGLEISCSSVEPGA